MKERKSNYKLGPMLENLKEIVHGLILLQQSL